MVPGLVIGGLWACGGSEPAPVKQPPTVPEELDLPADPSPTLSVPSPMEAQAAVRAAGIDQTLQAVVPTWNFKFEREASNVVAVRLGVLLADLVLTAKSADKAELLQRIEHMRRGVKTLAITGKMASALDDLHERVSADAMSREELLESLNAMSDRVLQGSSPVSERLLPLIKAGIWLEGTYCVAEAIREHGDAGPADTLLRQPDVVAYFERYASAEGLDNASAEQAEVLKSSLETLSSVAAEPEPLTMDHVKTVIQAVDAVLTEV